MQISLSEERRDNRRWLSYLRTKARRGLRNLLNRRLDGRVTLSTALYGKADRSPVVRLELDRAFSARLLVLLLLPLLLRALVRDRS